MSGAVARVLLVDDSPADVILAREALASSPNEIELHVVGDGEQAIAFLTHQGEYADSQRPDLVLLDLNIPGRSGHEILATLKSDPTCASIPVLVLSVSDDPGDIERAYAAHANAYVRKPFDFDEFTLVMRSIEDFWLATAARPRRLDR